jgi:hypothetical protein
MKVRETRKKIVTNKKQNMEIYSCQILFSEESIFFGKGDFPKILLISEA